MNYLNKFNFNLEYKVFLSSELLNNNIHMKYFFKKKPKNVDKAKIFLRKIEINNQSIFRKFFVIIIYKHRKNLKSDF